MQAVYQWLLNDDEVTIIEKQFFEDPESKAADRNYMSVLLHGVVNHHDELISRLIPYLDRAPAEVDPVERAILLIGSYELAYEMSVPHAAVINESVELARTYGAEQGHKYINGVLDRLAMVLRPEEKQE